METFNYNPYQNFLNREYLTYKEWKLIFQQRAVKMTASSEYLTYKEWKQSSNSLEISGNAEEIVSTLPIRNGNGHPHQASYH